MLHLLCWCSQVMTNERDVKLVCLYDRGKIDPEGYYGPVVNLPNFDRTMEARQSMTIRPLALIRAGHSGKPLLKYPFSTRSQVLVQKAFLKDTGRIVSEQNTANPTVANPAIFCVAQWFSDQCEAARSVFAAVAGSV